MSHHFDKCSKSTEPTSFDSIVLSQRATSWIFDDNDNDNPRLAQVCNMTSPHLTSPHHTSSPFFPLSSVNTMGSRRNDAVASHGLKYNSYTVFLYVVRVYCPINVICRLCLSWNTVQFIDIFLCNIKRVDLRNFRHSSIVSTQSYVCLSWIGSMMHCNLTIRSLNRRLNTAYTILDAYSSTHWVCHHASFRLYTIVTYLSLHWHNKRNELLAQPTGLSVPASYIV